MPSSLMVWPFVLGAIAAVMSLAVTASLGFFAGRRVRVPAPQDAVLGPAGTLFAFLYYAVPNASVSPRQREESLPPGLCRHAKGFRGNISVVLPVSKIFTALLRPFRFFWSGSNCPGRSSCWGLIAWPTFRQAARWNISTLEVCSLTSMARYSRISKLPVSENDQFLIAVGHCTDRDDQRREWAQGREFGQQQRFALALAVAIVGAAIWARIPRGDSTCRTNFDVGRIFGRSPSGRCRCARTVVGVDMALVRVLGNRRRLAGARSDR